MPKRWIAAVILTIVCVSTFAGEYVRYTESKHALHDARAALTRARANRKAVQLKLCIGQNSLKLINNRDRQTLIRSEQSNESAVPKLRQFAATMQTQDGKRIAQLLTQLIAGGIISAKREVKERPLLKPLPCRHLVGLSPVGKRAGPKTGK